MRSLLKFIVFFFACAMVVRGWLDVFLLSAINPDGTIDFFIPDPLLYSSIALGVVGLSVFFKRNIWAYLFLLTVIASFFPALSFTNLNLVIYIGPVKIDLIAISLLTAHVLLNPYMIRKPDLSPKEQEKSTNQKVDFFMRQLEKKSDEELLRLDDNDLLPEAIEAKRKILAERGL